MEPETLTLFFPPGSEGQAERFFDQYDFKGLIANSDSAYSKRALRGYSTRTCRFCGRSFPEASFSAYSHLLPQLIGNSSLYSDFECDDCNVEFSKLENDLANYLGISRSITGFSPDKKTVGFKSRRLSAKFRSFLGENILILAPEDVKGTPEELSFCYTKNPFTPVRAYRALLKSALSLLSDTEIKNNYAFALKYLAGKDYLEEGAVIGGYQLAFRINLPLHVYQFEKKRQADPLPTHLFAFYFQNRIIVFPVPFNRQDLRVLIEGYPFPLPPASFVSEEDRDNAMPTSFIRDMSSIEEITAEEETIRLSMDPKVLEQACVYDPVTGKIEPGSRGFGPAKYLVLVKQRLGVDPAALLAFIKEVMEGGGS